ncbi:hypothetical protein ACEUZ9_000906 [Paracoccus litorisediminis]|uniref:hypothetical protein n=1 Tax=Paracoccus litorisediminis TaxID=2006130 RepID=UPI003730F967
MTKDWTDPDTVEQTFYTMKDLDALAAALPVAGREGVMGGVAKIFGLPAMADLSDKAMKQVFVFARMKLDTISDQHAARARFRDLVIASIKGNVIENGAVNSRQALDAADPKDTDSQAMQASPAARPATQVEPQAPRAQQSLGLDTPPARPEKHPAAQARTQTAPNREIPDEANPARSGAPQSRPAAHVAAAVPQQPNAQPSPQSTPPTAPQAVPQLRVSAVPLFPNGPLSPERLPSDYAKLLLPRPKSGDRRALSAWISGLPWAPAMIAIGFPETPTNSDMVVDQEGELSQGPDMYLKRVGGIEISAPDPTLRDVNPAGHARWLLKVAGPEIDRAALADFVECLKEAIATFSNERLDLLKSLGAKLEFGSEAAALVSAASRLEAEFLDEMSDDRDRTAQLGFHASPNPQCRLDRGLALRRAAFMHVALGKDLGDALVEGLADLRQAQAMRLIEDDLGWEAAAAVSLTFNGVFFQDCRAALHSYRLAKNEHEMSF